MMMSQIAQNVVNPETHRMESHNKKITQSVYELLSIHQRDSLPKLRSQDISRRRNNNLKEKLGVPKVMHSSLHLPRHPVPQKEYSDASPVSKATTSGPSLPQGNFPIQEVPHAEEGTRFHDNKIQTLKPNGIRSESQLSFPVLQTAPKINFAASTQSPPLISLPGSSNTNIISSSITQQSALGMPGTLTEKNAEHMGSQKRWEFQENSEAASGNQLPMKAPSPLVIEKEQMSLMLHQVRDFACWCFLVGCQLTIFSFSSMMKRKTRTLKPVDISHLFDGNQLL
jgi:hypothetical protein